MSGTNRMPLLNLSNKCRKSLTPPTQTSERNPKNVDSKQDQDKLDNKDARKELFKAGTDTDTQLRTALKDVCMENDLVGHVY